MQWKVFFDVKYFTFIKLQLHLYKSNYKHITHKKQLNTCLNACQYIQQYTLTYFR